MAGDEGISLNQLVWGIRQQESHGDYNAYNDSSYGPSNPALGAYQILASNVPEWSMQALGHSITVDQFRTTPALQDQIARYKLGQYYSQYGAQGAATAWNSGSPTGNAQPGYVTGVLTYARQTPGSFNISGSTGAGTTPSGWPVQPPYDAAQITTWLAKSKAAGYKPVLTATQRKAVLDWVVQVYDTGNGGYPDAAQQKANRKNFTNKNSDDPLLQAYALMLTTGPKVSARKSANDTATGPFAGLSSVISWITSKSNWQRVGLAVLGVVILLAAVLYMVRGELPSPSQIATAVVA